MRFEEVARSQKRNLAGVNQAFLVYDNWDDYLFKTSFELVYFDGAETRFDIGYVKIMTKGMAKGNVTLPSGPFERLGSEYCSLGQGQNYYETIAQFSADVRQALLEGLRDCVFNLEIFEECADEPAMRASLLRSLDRRTVTETFYAALTGQVPATPFEFTYAFPPIFSSHFADAPLLNFSVSPRSNPPTNIHAIIGRNGVGKTRLLWDIATILCRRKSDESPATSGDISFGSFPGQSDDRFSRLVTVAYSAFDPFRAPREGSIHEGDIHYSYIGLRKRIDEVEDDGVVRTQNVAVKSDSDLTNEFVNSLVNCIRHPRLQRWQDSIKLLETDPGFEDLSLLDLPSLTDSERLVKSKEIFEELSSGHKIVLLTITRLVELVDERTLVLIDEPESHLHPPLLASLVRALSMLLTRRNGAAILATHSPVVLQEVPKTCVWMMRRSGKEIAAERPNMETFGENVGTLTSEVFGLEVKESGFHRLVEVAVDRADGNYSAVVESFTGHLGSEARAIALALSRSRK
jgi:predicted ATPase